MGNLPTLRWTWDSRPALNSNSSDTCIALSFPVTINPLALLVLAKGVEPLSSGASNQRSDRLSYTSKFMAGRAGFEPTRCTSSNTQGVWTSLPFVRLDTFQYILVGRVGLEPTYRYRERFTASCNCRYATYPNFGTPEWA